MNPFYSTTGSCKERHQSHVFFFTSLSWCFLFFVSFEIRTVVAECPTAFQLKTLVRQVDALSVRCFCVEDPPTGGWEVTCIRDSNFSPSVIVSKSMGHETYPMNASPLSFSIKFFPANAIEITCDESVPDFKPAIFQGFKVDGVDTFRFFNCLLPTMPLSVILHRTSVSRLLFSNSSLVDDEVVSEVRSLRIEFPEPRSFPLNHLKIILNGLDSLEKLSLHNLQIEVTSDHPPSSLIAPASIFYARHKRAVTSTSQPSARQPKKPVPLGTNIHNSATISSLSDEVATITTQSPPLRSQPQTSSSTSATTRTRSLQTTSSQLMTPSPSPAVTSSPITPSHSRPTQGKRESIVLLDKNPASNIGDEESRRVTTTQRSPATVTTPKSVPVPDFNLNNLLPNLKNILIETMFPENLSSSGHLLEAMLKDLKNLESVQLRNNHIRELRELTFVRSARRLTRLYLIGNRIQVMHSRVFSNMFNLEVLDLFNNNLTQLPDGLFADLTSLSTLRLGRNLFQSLPENLLWPMKGLKSLDLNRNQNLTSLPKRFLSNSVALKNLSMSDCNMKQLSSDSGSFFASSVALENIELRGNHLPNLTASGLFANNPILKKIDVSYNNIASISPEIFSSNSSALLELNLYANDLTSIDSSCLTNLKSLKVLKLGFNNITSLAPDLLFSLRKLEDLDLSRNFLTTVNPQHSRLPFGLGSAQLRKLNLSRNNITDFSEFSSIDWSLYLKITEIDLSRNQISSSVLLPVFHSTAPHVILDLSSNEIRSVRMSDIIQYESGVLQAARDARISETFDERSSWKPSSLTSITQVIIRLDKNPLDCDCRLEPFLTYANASSRDLEAALRGLLNRVSFDFFSPDLKCNQPSHLADVPLFKVNPWNLTCLLEDSRVCPHDCVCLYRSFDKHAYINCENRNLESIPEEILQPFRYTNVSLSDDGPIDERFTVKTVSLLLSNNEISDLDGLRILFTEQEPELVSGNGVSFEVYLDNNRIENIPADLLQQRTSEKGSVNGEVVGEGTTTTGGTKGTAENVFTPLRVLSLRNNYLQHIPVPFLKSIGASASSSQNSTTEPLVKLYLGNNPFNCSSDEKGGLPANINECGLIFFKSWLTKNYNIVQDVKEVTCSDIIKNTLDAGQQQNQQQQSIVEIPDSDLCPQLLSSNEGSLFALSIICLILSCLTLMLCILYYKNKQTFLAFIYIHVQPVFLCLNFSEDDLDEDKLYDAFVSYSSSDRDIVMEMIEKLEKPSDVSQHSISFLKQQSGIPSIHEGNSDQIVPEHAVNKNTSGCKDNSATTAAEDDGNYFTLCIHERDWLPGNLISWNIVNSVQNSRRTILILSREFIRSIWFQVEFHTAYYQMLEDKMDRLIVIVRGELPPKEEMDQDLVFLLTTKTYLTWGERWFWEKLRYALPHRKGQKMLKIGKPLEAHNRGGKVNGLATQNGRIKQSKTDLMKEYVDQTISDHFQLQQKSDVVRYSDRYCNNQSPKTSSKRGHVNQSFVSESEA